MKISVCIASFNGAKYLKDQLDSIISQLPESSEILISDDGSKDKTIALINEYSDPRITLYKNSFRNIVKNFEFLLTKAKGDYIFLCDQDDIWLSDKISKVMSELSSNDLVVHDAIIVDENLNEICDSFYKTRKSASGFLKNLYKNSYIGCCMAFRREVLQNVLPFPSNIPMHDSWIGCLLDFNNNKVKFIGDKLLLYRRHGHNASPESGKSKFSFLKKMNFRIFLCYHVLKRSNKC